MLQSRFYVYRKVLQILKVINMKGVQKFYQYAEITARKTKYADKMMQLKSSIFGELPPNATRKAQKVHYL